MKQLGPAAISTLAFAALTFVLPSSMAQDSGLHTERVPLRVGETFVHLVVQETGAIGLTYLVLHDNEDTGAEAVRSLIRRRGGRLLELCHSGERNVTFRLGGRSYTFDPNRIFTDAGAAATLEAHGRNTPEAHAAVRAFAQELVGLLALERERVVVTVHNNTAGEYSTLSYLNEPEYTDDAASAHLAHDEDPDNFFFVTEPGLYERLRKAGYNAVLQDNARVTDDGSLSVYVGRLGIPYVNVEAQHGQVEEQIRMLDFLNEVLSGHP